MRIGVIVGKSNPAWVKFVMDAILKQFPNAKIITEQGRYSKLLMWAVEKVSFGNVEETAFMLFIDVTQKKYLEYMHPVKYFTQKGIMPFIDYFQEEIEVEEEAPRREKLVLTPPIVKKSSSINYRQGQLFAPKFGQ